MSPRRHCPTWVRSCESSLLAIGGAPPLWNRLRLRLTYLVFTDQHGNFVLVDPERPRPLGLAKDRRRPPTIYFAATSEEFEACAEAMLPILERELVGGRRQYALLDRVREIRERLAKAA